MTTTGYVACDYDDGDMLADVRHGEIRETDAQARQDAAKDRWKLSQAANCPGLPVNGKRNEG